MTPTHPPTILITSQINIFLPLMCFAHHFWYFPDYPYTIWIRYAAKVFRTLFRLSRKDFPHI
jgi:hypothetical protein